jgi:hypothetical protein
MADATGAAFFFEPAAPFDGGAMDSAMIEFLFIYQLARNPVQAVARRWWCRSLFRVTRGKRRCRGCTNS